MATSSSTSATANGGEALLKDAWAYYQLPIFYTLQPNPPTRQKQVALWADLLIQNGLRQCSLANKNVIEYEKSQQSGDLLSSSASPLLQLRSVSNKLNALPSDTCPFATLFTSDDSIFINQTLNRRLPRSVIGLIFQTAMLMYPNRCISNVPMTHAVRPQGDTELYGSAASSASASGKQQPISSAVDEGSSDRMGSWLSSLFSGSKHKRALAENTPQQQQQSFHNAEAASPNEIDAASASHWLVVFANGGGHTSIMTDHVMPWVLEMGGGLTTANLKKNGVITTFDELASENALSYTPPTKEGRGGAPVSITYTPPIRGMPPRLLGPSVNAENPTNAAVTATKMANGITNEYVLRLLLHYYQHSAAAAAAGNLARITLFNLDDSDRQPYEGVKFGGEGV